MKVQKKRLWVNGSEFTMYLSLPEDSDCECGCPESVHRAPTTDGSERECRDPRCRPNTKDTPEGYMAIPGCKDYTPRKEPK